jgi:hypothetical protein
MLKPRSPFHVPRSTFPVACAICYVLCAICCFPPCYSDNAYTPTLTPKKVYIGDTFTYKVTVPVDGTVSLSIPLLTFIASKNTRDIAIEVTTPEVKIHSKTLFYSVAVTPYQTGLITFPTLNFQGQLVRSITFNIISLVAESGTPNPRAMKKPVNSYTDLWLLFFLISLCTAGSAIYFHLKKQFEAGTLTLPFIKKTKSPEEIWQEYSAYFLTLTAPELPKTKKFYIETSEKIKKFCFDLLHIDMLDMTTLEIVRNIDSTELTHKDKLVQVLTEADKVKFAKYIPETGEIQEYIRLLQYIIEQYKPGAILKGMDV